MAFPAIASVTQSSEAASVTNPTIDLPATVAAGDLLIAAVSQDGASTWTWPGGWTELRDGTFGTHSLSVAYRIADGTEGGGNVSPTATVAERCTQFCIRILAADWDGTAPPEAAALVTGTSATPDPPNVTASWGSADNLFIAIWSADGGWPTTGYPANYTHTQHESTATPTSAGYYGVASRQLAAASDNPGTAAITASDSWQATTLVVKPSAGGASDALAGVIAGVSTLAGDLTPAAAAALAGVVGGISTLSAELTPAPSASLAGVVAAVSGVSGGLLDETPAPLPTVPAIGNVHIAIWGPSGDPDRWDQSVWDGAQWVFSEWVEITDKCQQVNGGWGADNSSQGILTQVAANAWTINTYDPDRELDPSNNDAPLHSVLRPGTHVKWWFDDGVEFADLKEGTIDVITYSVQSQRGQIRVVDRIGQIAAAKIPAGTTGVPTTLYAAARRILVIAGLDNVVWVDDPPGADPATGPGLTDEASVWDWLNTLSLDALHSAYVIPWDMSVPVGSGVNERSGIRSLVTFGDFQNPFDAGLQIGGALGIPMEDIAPESSRDGVFSRVTAFDDGAPTTPVVRTNDDAVNKFGIVPYVRERVLPDGGAWADFVLADRAGASLQYHLGTIRPVSGDQLLALFNARMLNIVRVVADSRDNGNDPLESVIDVDILLLGVRFEANTVTGWSAHIEGYVTAVDWQ